ncbi:glycosyltransferase family 4 protein [Marinobacter salicampi]|uniref:glycosyltransferase family 4 protein n=1 Tax=Marinobacter salicampi TaxID=435907 RepID=UPI00140B5435|nr:glycosyltransferase family 1 protein [Marinobacter salicampi]
MTNQSRTERCNGNIVVISETFAPEVNGVANTLKYLCQGLLGRGFRVTVVRPRQAADPKTSRTNTGNALFTEEQLVHSLPLPGYPSLRFGLARTSTLARQWRQRQPDAVYVATQGPLGVVAVAAARRLGIPVFSGFHTNFHSYSRHYGVGFLAGLICQYGRWFHNRTDITLAPSRKALQALHTMGIGPTALWSRGVDCQRFTPQKRDMGLRQAWGLKPLDRAFLYVGRLAPEKNLAMAVASFERIRSLYPSARFVLVGDGPLGPRLAARHPDYIFCGTLQGEALARHYASADIFLFPSKTDTFGNVVLEAMASGLGIVAYDDGAAGEHIRSEDNGLVSALDDDSGFTDHAMKLLEQPSLLSRVRTQARRDALELRWTQVIDQFVNIVLSNHIKGRQNDVKQSLQTI